MIDAFSCTLHGISVSKCIEDVLHLGDLNWLENSIGRYGYHRTTFFGSIRIFSDGRPDMGILLELQGQGCRELEMLSKNSSIFYCILSSIIPTRISLTRIDIAVDDFNQRLSLDQIRQKVDRGEVVTRLRHRVEYKGLYTTDGQTVYLGSRTGDYFIRFYDKAAEQNTSFPWIRAEIEIRHSAAHEFAKTVLNEIQQECPEKDAQIVLFGIRVLADKVRFIDSNDKNKTRCTTSSWWTCFLQEADPLHLNTAKLSTPDIDEALEWMKKQCAGTFALLAAYLGPSFVETLIKDGLMKADRFRAKKWSQEMMAAGISPEITIDENTDIEEAFSEICEQLSSYFAALQ